ncbi:MAG: DUF763 domain-containing protein [Bacteroidota bacterium]
MKKSGHADLPLHYGRVPPWLAERMATLGKAITEAIVVEYGKSEVLKRLSDPLWFQSFGAVLGMDWHSSGITTSVMGALKKSLNPISKDLGIYICGGRGKHSRKTPTELLQIADKTGLNGHHLVKCSRLSAKVDNTAIQDGFQIYLHSFVVTDEGEWAVIQQGMNDRNGFARRYHWHSQVLESFINDPHTSVCGENQGLILNLTADDANTTRDKVLELSSGHPDAFIKEVRKILMPAHHDVRMKDVDMKRLGTIIALAYESELQDFESLLLLKGLGPRTLQSLTLVSEVIHGTPSRFKDPARFSFAHGGKDGHPFPVPTKVYDETIEVLNTAVQKAKIGHTDKQKALKSLHLTAKRLEKGFTPTENLNKLIKKEWEDSKKYGGRTVFDDKHRKNRNRPGGNQLKLF